MGVDAGKRCSACLRSIPKGLEVPRAQRTDGVGEAKGLYAFSGALCSWDGGGCDRGSKLGWIFFIQLQRALYKGRDVAKTLTLHFCQILYSVGRFLISRCLQMCFIFF